MSQNKILMLLDNAYLPDSRVENEINALLEENYHVTLCCMESSTLPKHVEKDSFIISREIPESLHKPFDSTYREYCRSLVNRMVENPPNFIHCHDFRMFYLGCRIKQKLPEVKLIYDSHEYLKGYPYFIRIKSWTSKIKGLFVWLYYVLKESISLKEADAIITVSKQLKKKLEKRSKKPSFLVRNIPPNAKICMENCTYWHKTFDLDPEKEIVIHTGNAHYSDKRLIWLFKSLKKYDLALVFLGTNNSLNRAKELSLEHGFKDVYFHKQLPREEITFYCSQADFGLAYTWNKFWKSYWYALPNKLIDVSLAGLPVLSTAQPELKQFIQENENGVTFNGNKISSLDNAIAKLLKDKEQLKEKASKVGNTVSWDHEKRILLDLYRNKQKR